jgi:hypothetical protein
VNRTRVFVISEDDWSEKTGNVSFFVEISAFNKNYSIYESMSHHSRNQDWRWRLSEHRFNLTILPHSKYVLARLKSQISCFNGRRKTLSARENCEMIFNKNITIDHVGLITIKLSDYFSFPDNFKKLFNDGDSELNSIFKISLAPNRQIDSSNFTFEMISYTDSLIEVVKRGKKISERSRKE